MVYKVLRKLLIVLRGYGMLRVFIFIFSESICKFK